MRISDWSADVCSSDLLEDNRLQALALSIAEAGGARAAAAHMRLIERLEETGSLDRHTEGLADHETYARRASEGYGLTRPELRSEEHTSELQSLMRSSYAVFCLNKNKVNKPTNK